MDCEKTDQEIYKEVFDELSGTGFRYIFVLSCLVSLCSSLGFQLVRQVAMPYGSIAITIGAIIGAIVGNVVGKILINVAKGFLNASQIDAKLQRVVKLGGDDGLCSSMRTWIILPLLAGVGGQIGLQASGNMGDIGSILGFVIGSVWLELIVFGIFFPLAEEKAGKAIGRVLLVGLLVFAGGLYTGNGILKIVGGCLVGTPVLLTLLFLIVLGRTMYAEETGEQKETLRMVSEKEKRAKRYLAHTVNWQARAFLASPDKERDFEYIEDWDDMQRIHVAWSWYPNDLKEEEITELLYPNAKWAPGGLCTSSVWQEGDIHPDRLSEIEYVLAPEGNLSGQYEQIRGFADTLDHAEKLARWYASKGERVSIIDLNQME